MTPYGPCSNKQQRAAEHNPSPIGGGFFFALDMVKRGRADVNLAARPGQRRQFATNGIPNRHPRGYRRIN
jgi:hypothetical protein